MENEPLTGIKSLDFLHYETKRISGIAVQKLHKHMYKNNVGNYKVIFIER